MLHAEHRQHREQDVLPPSCRAVGRRRLGPAAPAAAPSRSSSKPAFGQHAISQQPSSTAVGVLHRPWRRRQRRRLAALGRASRLSAAAGASHDARRVDGVHTSERLAQSSSLSDCSSAILSRGVPSLPSSLPACRYPVLHDRAALPLDMRRSEGAAGAATADTLSSTDFSHWRLRLTSRLGSMKKTFLSPRQPFFLPSVGNSGPTLGGRVKDGMRRAIFARTLRAGGLPPASRAWARGRLQDDFLLRPARPRHSPARHPHPRRAARRSSATTRTSCTCACRASCAPRKRAEMWPLDAMLTVPWSHALLADPPAALGAPTCACSRAGRRRAAALTLRPPAETSRRWRGRARSAKFTGATPPADAGGSTSCARATRVWHRLRTAREDRQSSTSAASGAAGTQCAAPRRRRFLPPDQQADRRAAARAPRSTCACSMPLVGSGRLLLTTHASDAAALRRLADARAARRGRHVGGARRRARSRSAAARDRIVVTSSRTAPCSTSARACAASST